MKKEISTILEVWFHPSMNKINMVSYVLRDSDNSKAFIEVIWSDNSSFSIGRRIISEYRKCLKNNDWILLQRTRE